MYHPAGDAYAGHAGARPLLPLQSAQALNSSFAVPARASGSVASFSVQQHPGSSPSHTMAPSFSNTAAASSPPNAGPSGFGVAPGVGSSQAAAGSTQTPSRSSKNERNQQGGVTTNGSLRDNSAVPSSRLECQDQQCAEEECDPEECGDEHRGPRNDNYTCGIDRRPLLPVLLIVSTLIGALHMTTLQFPLVRKLFDGAYYTRAFFLILYATTLGCMVFCALGDPGQLRREDTRRAYSRLGHAHSQAAASIDGPDTEEDPPLPERAHKMWLYKLPIKRYDHYCRWLTNAVGLLNHREFILMVGGLVTIGITGAMLDLVLLVFTAHDGAHFGEALLLIMHLSYSLIVAALAGPIFRLHVGFISRNELADDWKRNLFYVATSLRTGKSVPVNDLSDDEFNELFDSFQYDPKKNPWDKGALTNCWTFWCTSRWPADQMGNF